MPIKHLSSVPIFVSVIVMLINGCATTSAEIPLSGVHMLRPSAGRKTFGIRVATGIEQAPEIQGVVNEVTDPNGNMINDTVDYQGSGVLFTNGDYNTSVIADIAIDAAQRFELGWSTTRGLYAFVNAVDSDYFTLALSPSYNQSTTLSRDRDSSLESGEKKFSSTTIDTSLTAIASLFLGSHQSGGFCAYAGYGLHRFSLELVDDRSGSKASASQIAPAMIMGFGIDSIAGSIFLETALTRLRQRDGDTPMARTFALGAGFLIGK